MPTDAATGGAIASDDRPSRRRSRRLGLSEKAAALALLAVVSTAVLAFAASDVTTATLFSGVYAAFLGGLLLTCDWARRDLAKLPGLGLQAAAFALLIATVLWPLTPWGPDGPHPIWAYVPEAGASLTIDRSALLLNVLRLLGLAALFVAGRIIGASEARALWFLKAAVAALGCYAALAFVDHVVARRSARLVATLLSPNSAATTFGAGMLLAVAAAVVRFRRYPGLTVLRRGDPEAMLWLGVVALLATVVCLTASRAGGVAALIGLGLLLGWNVFAQRQTVRGGAALAALAAVLLVAAIALRSADPLTGRFNVLGRDLDIRSEIFAAHWQAFITSPWSGFGLGSFPTVNQLVVTQGSLSTLYDVRAAHSLYLQWLEEGGIVGAGAMLAVFGLLLWPILRAGLADSTAGVWARAIACAAVLFLVHGLTDFALQAPAIQALCALVLGVGGGLVGRGASRRGQVEPGPVGPLLGFAAAVVAMAAAAGAPLVAARLDHDLSGLPTAPAEALAQTIDTRLSQPAGKSRDLDRLKRLSERELALAPASGAAWLRRAAIEADLNDSAASNLALEHSFAVAPLQTSLFEPRAVFAYEHWDRLSPEAREKTAYQLKAEWRRTGDQARYVALANSLRNPAGRVGMALQIAALRLAAALETAR